MLYLFVAGGVVDIMSCLSVCLSVCLVVIVASVLCAVCCVTVRPGLIAITPAIQSSLVSSTSAHVNGTGEYISLGFVL